MRTLPTALFLAVAIGSSAASASTGRVFVANDDWILSNQGFGAAPDTPLFVQNLLDWFLQGQPSGKFLAHTGHFSLTGSALASTVTALGHEWTVGTGPDYDTLDELLEFDGVFVCSGPSPDRALLVEYVLAGGCVYVAAGNSSAPCAAQGWSPFVHGFGFEFACPVNGVVGVAGLQSSHPTLAGVSGLYHVNGNDIVDLQPTSPSNEVIAVFNGHALFAVFDDDLAASRICSPAVPNSTGMPGRIIVTGSDDVADDDLTLAAIQLPSTSNLGYFIMGTGSNTFTPPGSAGPICVAPGLVRLLPRVSNTDELPGGFYRHVGTTGPGSGAITPGSTWGFQAWHRDASAGTSNLTDAVRVLFQ